MASLRLLVPSWVCDSVAACGFRAQIRQSRAQHFPRINLVAVSHHRLCLHLDPLIAYCLLPGAASGTVIPTPYNHNPQPANCVTSTQ
jgi:hypothetical protein